MKTRLQSSGFLLATLLLAACGGDEDKVSTDGPDTRIDSVAGFLAAVCEKAALCQDISATQEEIDACPAEIQQEELSQSQVAELERFTTYAKTQQDCILGCIGQAICSRFGGSLSAISDSDVVEPFCACEQECL